MLKELAGGLVGAAAVNVLNESIRRTVPHAPRMDVIGTRALRQGMKAVGVEPPHWNRALPYALAGDIASNALYYAAAGAGSRRHVVARGLALGLLGGIGAVALPPMLGLGNQPHRRSPFTELGTVAYYVVGGLVAAGAMRLLSGRDDD
ncbi:MAG TPA: hypothetical protein VF796_26945 [Humisphaera sp.]